MNVNRACFDRLNLNRAELVGLLPDGYGLMSQHWCSSRFHNFLREWKCSPVSIWTPVKVHGEPHPLSITHYVCHHIFMCRWNGDESQIRQHGFSPRGEPTCACLQFLIISWRKCLISVSKTVWKKKKASWIRGCSLADSQGVHPAKVNPFHLARVYFFLMWRKSTPNISDTWFTPPRCPRGFESSSCLLVYTCKHCLECKCAPARKTSS